MAAAPPFVVVLELHEAVVPTDEWTVPLRVAAGAEGARAGVPGLRALRRLRPRRADGAVRVHCYTTWDTPEQLEAFLERGYTFERLLATSSGIDAEREPRDGEDLLMARAAARPRARSPATATSAPDVRHSRRAASAPG